jgi:hypothetical protein
MYEWYFGKGNLPVIENDVFTVVRSKKWGYWPLAT